MSYQEILIKILLSLVIGGTLGIDRESKRQPAGFRTYMLVCLGSASAMMTGYYVYARYGIGDPSRIGAQVVSGIGFLGAGTIIVTRKSQVKGLTTAAGLWTAACAGLAVGIGFYRLAILMGLTVLFIMTVLQHFDHYLENHARQVNLYISFDTQEHFDDFVRQKKGVGCRFTDLRISRSEERDAEVIATLTLILPKQQSHADLFTEWSKAEGVRTIEEI